MNMNEKNTLKIQAHYKEYLLQIFKKLIICVINSMEIQKEK